MARKSFLSPLGLALLCGHCALTGVAALFAAGGLLGFTLFGIGFEWIWPPVAILGGFALYVWSGRRKGSCDLPPAEAP